MTCLHAQESDESGTPSQTHAADWLAHARSPERLLVAFTDAREAFMKQARRTRLACGLIGVLKTSFHAQGVDSNPILENWKGIQAMSKYVRGQGAAGLGAVIRWESFLSVLIYVAC